MPETNKPDDFDADDLREALREDAEDDEVEEDEGEDEVDELDEESDEGDPEPESDDEGKDEEEDEPVVRHMPPRPLPEPGSDDKPRAPTARRSPPPRRAPPPPREAPPRQAMSADMLLRQESNAQFENIVRAFNTNPAQHKIQVYRIEPERDVETNTNMKGLLGSFDHEVDDGVIKERFGGGVYDVIVRGPGPNGKGNMIKAKMRVSVPGPPIKPLEMRVKAEKANEEATLRILEKQIEREADEKRILREEVKETQNTIVQLLAAKKDDGGVAALIAEMARKEDARRQEEREERKLEEIRRRDEEAKREAKEQRERDERRREEDKKEERRREEDRKREDEQRKREDREREDRRAEEKLREDRARADRETQQRVVDVQMKQFELQLKQQQELAHAREQAAREEMKMMMEMQKEHSKSEREAMQRHIELLRETMKNTKGNDITSLLAQMQAMREFIDPPEDKEEPKERWEKFADRVMPALMGIAGGFGKQAQVQQAAQQQNEGGGPPQLTPGSVVVADSDEEAEYEDDEESDAVPETPIEVVRIQNFPDKYVGTEPDALMVEIVQRLDLAVAREVSTEEAFTRIIKPLPDQMKLLATTATADQMLAIIEANVPADWPLKSAAGSMLVKNLFKMVAEKAMKGEV